MTSTRTTSPPRTAVRQGAYAALTAAHHRLPGDAWADWLAGYLGSIAESDATSLVARDRLRGVADALAEIGDAR